MSSRFPMGVATTNSFPATSTQPTGIMGTVSTEQTPGYYTWTAQNRAFTVRIAFAAIEKINVEVMRGFGVTRRRGTEPGGILIGHVEQDSAPVVTIDSFEAVP